FEENGVRYHHIIDPRTGHSAGKVRSATILAPTATQTDGMSKTAFVLGPEKALEIINRMPEYDAVFVCPDGRALYSNGLRPPLPRCASASAAAHRTSVLMRAAAAVAHRQQLFRLRFQGAAVAAARGVLRAVALGRHAAGGAEEVAGGVEVEGVRCPHLVLEAAVMLLRAAAGRFTHQLALLAGGGLGLAAVGIDDK